MKLQIVIPCINLWEKYTKNCIENVQKTLGNLGIEYRIMLIDNASSDETIEAAGLLVSNTFAHARYETPNSFSKSVNIGIKDGIERGYDHFLVLNNDVLLNNACIRNLLLRIETGDVAMVTAMNIKGETTPQDIYSFDWANKRFTDESEHPDFSCFMISKAGYEQVGEFDEGFKPAYYEDNDYHYRITLAGMKAICLPTAVYYHFGSGTQNEAKPFKLVNDQMFLRNRNYYVAKWGGMPGHETYKHPFNDETKNHTFTQQST